MTASNIRAHPIEPDRSHKFKKSMQEFKRFGPLFLWPTI